MAIIILVADSLGIGALPDAALYQDEGSNTLSNVAKAVGGLRLPLLTRMGLGNLVLAQGVPPAAKPMAAHGRLAEASAGKDSTTGHWELMGLILKEPFPTYPHGFPPDVMAEFERRIGRKSLGNKPASGTKIIAELGVRHQLTGRPIVYTSGDSVFQVAAHEHIICLNELYRICKVAEPFDRSSCCSPGDCPPICR